MGIFDWLKGKQTIDNSNVTKFSPRRPAPRDWTDDLVVNKELTKGLFHNTYPGMKLAGGLAFAPIAIPVWLMGYPVPSPVEEDESASEDIEYLLDHFKTEMKQIHLQCHRDGTIWIFPKWVASLNKLIWEFIPDPSVSDIIRDIETGEIVEIIVDELLGIKIGENKVVYVRRKRYFTTKKITELWLEGKDQVPKELKSKTYRNIAGILPVPFSNNKDAEEVRGYPDLERIITDLKSYHDIDLQRSNMLAKFQPKMVQRVNDPASWLSNNGYTDINQIKVYDLDVIINKGEVEATEFQSLDFSAYTAYEGALKQKFQKIVEASGVPEIAWGLKTTGNNASVEESMASLVKFVIDKQEQKTNQYEKLFFASLSLYRMATIGGSGVPLKIKWNDLDAVSDATKATVFKGFAEAVGVLVKNAAMTKEQLLNLWTQLYPKATKEEYDIFVLGLSDMAQHVQYTNASYSETLDFKQQEEEITE